MYFLMSYLKSLVNRNGERVQKHKENKKLIQTFWIHPLQLFSLPRSSNRLTFHINCMSHCCKPHQHILSTAIFLLKIRIYLRIEEMQLLHFGCIDSSLAQHLSIPLASYLESKHHPCQVSSRSKQMTGPVVHNFKSVTALRSQASKFCVPGTSLTQWL